MPTDVQGASSRKMRRVRKGTRSCWDCKRRKVRCIFASESDTTCRNCQRRGTACIGQEVPEDLVPRDTAEPLDDRLGRVEQLVRTLVKSNGDRKLISIHEPRLLGKRSSGADLVASRPATEPFLTPAVSTSPPTPGSLRSEAAISIRCADITRALLMSLPCSADLDIILDIVRCTKIYLHLPLFVSYNTLERLGLSALQFPSRAELTDTEAHPVLLSKQLILLALCLQVIAHGTADAHHQWKESPKDVAERLAEANVRHITTNEDLYGTVEVLECIILEAVYEKCCGRLRKAFLATRRAMNAAQMMGINRPRGRPAKTITPGYPFDAQHLWIRIVFTDRVLCMMMGLPQGSVDTSMASATAMADDSLLGKFDRLILATASRILERNELSPSEQDITTTKAIDAELIQIGRCLPSKMWLTPQFVNIELGSVEEFWATSLLVAQTIYYSLLLSLHLPYLLKFDPDGKYDYSKTTCASASREILTRYIAYRTFNINPMCHRASEFLALMASTTLLLAHFDSHLNKTARNCLAHQRLGDRAQIEKVLDTMDVMGRFKDDVLCHNCAIVLKRLLEVETDAAEGRQYAAHRLPERISVSEHDGETCSFQEEDGDDFKALRVCLPYFGSIRIMRQRACKSDSSRSSNSSDVTGASSGGDAATTIMATAPSPRVQVSYSMDNEASQDPMLWSQNLPDMVASLDDWTFQGIDVAFFDNIMRNAPFHGDSGVVRQP